MSLACDWSGFVTKSEVNDFFCPRANDQRIRLACDQITFMKEVNGFCFDASLTEGLSASIAGCQSALVVSSTLFVADHTVAVKFTLKPYSLGGLNRELLE